MRNIEHASRYSGSVSCMSDIIARVERLSVGLFGE